MADNGAKVPSPPFDVRTIKDLVALMSRHDLSEIDLREGEMRIRLRRGPQGMMSLAPVPGVMAAPAMAAPAAAVPAPTGTASKSASKDLIEIRAQMPGTFYSAQNPESQPYVKLGSRVTPTTIVCIVEAMKVMSEIPAECTGVIAEICVNNAEPVEYNRVMFRVDPAG